MRLPFRKEFTITRGPCLGGILSFLGLESEKIREDPVVHTIKLAILNLQRGDYEKSERLLHLALKMSQERNDAKAEIYCFDVMADVAKESGNLHKAEQLYVEVMRRLIASGTRQDDNAIVEISGKLASIFSQRHEDEKAEQGFEFCIDTQQRKLDGIDLGKATFSPEEGNSAALLGVCLDWYAKHFMERGNYGRAKELLVKAVGIAENVLGNTNPQTLVIRNDLALCHTMLKNYKESIRILEQIIESGFVDEEEHLPTYLCNIGENYLASGDMANAEKWCTRARDAAKKHNLLEAMNCAELCLTKASEARGLQRERGNSK